MQDAIVDTVASRIHRVHCWLLDATVSLSEDVFSQRVGVTSPSIGWHLWHISRWADRVQL